MDSRHQVHPHLLRRPMDLPVRRLNMISAAQSFSAVQLTIAEPPGNRRSRFASQSHFIPNQPKSGRPIP